MQVLAPATETGSADECARVMLDGMPSVMWFIRCNMRKSRAAGLSVPQFRALCLIDRYPTANLSLVAEHLGSSQPSASRLISGLVARGFVKRREGEDDRRQIALAMTARGRSVLATARAATQKHLADEIDHLSEEQRRTVIDSMSILLGVFGNSSK